MKAPLITAQNIASYHDLLATYPPAVKLHSPLISLSAITINHQNTDDTDRS